MELQFGSYRLKTRERQLWDAESAIDLDGRSVDVLRALLEKPNALVLKDEIFSAVWPGSVVGENTLQVHISALRKALGAEVIETVHGRGYKYRGPEPEVMAAEAAERRGSGERPVIAVLPCKALDGEASLKSCADVLTEATIEQLSRFSLLSVVPHPVLPGAAAADGARDEGLAADFLLLGEVNRSGPKVRISSKLQDSRTRVVVWAEHYDRSLKDIFAVIDELSGTIAGRINNRIESQMVTRQAAGRALTSYDHLIKGIWHFRSQAPEGPDIAEQLFRKARELNPGNAEALRWLSMRMTCRWLSEHRRDCLLEGLALGRAAAELDPASATCHAAHGFAQLWASGVESAGHSFRKAYSANPNDGYMLADVALAHFFGGKVDEGYAVLERAEHLNPFPNDWHSHYRSIGLFMEERYAQAIEGFHRIPLGVHSLVYLMACHGHLANGAALEALRPSMETVTCDLQLAALDEPFADRMIADRLSEGVGKALALAGLR